MILMTLPHGSAFFHVLLLLGLSAKGMSSHEAIYEVSEMEVSDAPRYVHRGVMVDVSRNFHTASELLKLIDVLAMYKLNRLHLHLADDEGWRLQIPGLDELTEVWHDEIVVVMVKLSCFTLLESCFLS